MVASNFPPGSAWCSLETDRQGGHYFARREAVIASVRQHVKEEENTFFPRLGSVVSQEDLIRVAEEMQATADDLAKQVLLMMAELAGADMSQP